MKRIIPFILVLAMICPLLPLGGIAAMAAAPKDTPTLIHLNKDCEAQNQGDTVYGFYIPKEAHYKYFLVENVAKGDNAGNKAMKLVGNSEGAIARLPWQYVPITKDFVISMDIMQQETVKSKNMYLYMDALESRNTRFLDTGTAFTLMSLNESMKVNGIQIPTITFEANKWYNITFDMNVKSKNIGVYIDGVKYGSDVSMPAFTNLAEFRITSPEEGGDYYIDNMRIYESEDIMSEEDYSSALSEWKASPLCPPEKYEAGGLHRYNKFVYITLYNKFLARIGSDKVYKDNKMNIMPAPVLEDEDNIVFPVRGISEIMGAEVSWDSGLNKVTVKYGDKKLEAIVNDEIYYVNGKPQKLFYPLTVKNGSVYLSLEVLAHFFDMKYTRDGYLINFGDEITFDRDLGPMGQNQWGRTYEQEITDLIDFFMIYDRPTADEILEIYRQNNPEGSTGPKVMINDFDKIKEGMQKDPEYAALINTIIGKADSTMNSGYIEYTTPDGQRASFSGPLYNIGTNNALAYKVTGDKKYLDYIVETINIIANDFPDLHPVEVLDLGNSANGLAPMYDWLKDDLTEEQRQTLEDIIVKMVFDEFEYIYACPYYNSETALAFNSGNQIIIINNGIIGCAIALMDKYPERCSRLIECALRNIERAYMTFAPDGGFPEGLSYWLYTVDTLPYTLASLENAFGDDFYFSDVPGLKSTIYYALSANGSVGGFPLGDAAIQTPFHGMFMWHANVNNDKSIAELRKNNMSSASIIDVINWVYDTDGADGGLENIEGDSYYTKLNNVTMRTGWSKGDTSVIFHGGANNDGHGHLDIGTFQFDMLGERWADELPKEDYNLTGYGAYNKDDAVAGHPYGSHDYYRNKGEGHNVVIAGLGNTRYDMVKTAKAPVIKHSFTDTLSYAIIDVTEGNENYEQALRGVQLDKLNNQVIVQDNYRSSVPMEYWWSMITKAKIELSDDKRCAILSMNGKRIWASIISDGPETFSVLDAAPMREYTADGIAFPPPLQSANTGYRKLAIQNPSTDNLKLTVAFKPLVGDETVPSIVPVDIPMEQWTAVEAERAHLNSVTVDGKPLAGFVPGVYNYDLSVVTEKDPVPKVEVTADEKYDVEVIESTTVPGVTNVILRENGKNVGMYSFTITPLNDTTKFINERQIPIVSYTVTSEPQPENNAANLFDANDETKFATDENGGGVTIDFGEVKTVKEIMMSFVSGTARKEIFTIEYSADGISFTKVFEGSNSGTTKELESFDIGSVPARYIRVSFFGNSLGTPWVSVKELCAFTE